LRGEVIHIGNRNYLDERGPHETTGHGDIRIADSCYGELCNG
jgi:hypothetical protein